MKFQTRLIIIILCLSIIPLIILSSLSIIEGNEKIKTVQITSMKKTLNSIENKISNSLEFREQNIQIIRDDSSTKHILSKFHSNESIEEYPKYASETRTIIDLWYTMMEKIPGIMTIELYDLQENPIISLENIDGNPTLFLNSTINDKDRHNIIAELSKSAMKNEIIISDFQISDFYESSMIFYHSTPVFIDNKMAGILIIESAAEYLLQDEIRDNPDDFVLVNSKQNLFVHFDNDLGFHPHEDFESLDFPFMLSDVMDSTENFFIDNNSIFIIEKIILDEDHPDSFITILMGSYEQPINDLSIIVIGILIVTIILVSFLGILLSRKFLHPLHEIERAANDIATGNLNARLLNDGDDEIIRLSKSLNSMINSLKNALEAEKKLAKSEKLSIIGQLSANIAHDIRNPLYAISSSSKIIQNNVTDEKTKNEILRINRAVSRISHQVNSIMDFVRITPLKLEEQSILSLLNNVLTNTFVPSNISIVLPKIDLILKLDPIKMENALHNLILNAVQAIGENDGTITIQLSDYNEKIKIAFSNTGPKIPEEFLPNIFEPLFTTKEKGTGLGLSSVKNIIAQHGGKISVEQEPVTFIITLPKL